ncbi:MAG: hypothetical protein ACI8VT_003284 [Saprospiraceae bacterium]|jgi:hypothetical protein
MIMKRHLVFNFNKRFVLSLLTLLLIGGGNLFAQNEEANQEKDKRPVKNTFESIWLIDNQTVMIPIKGTFEFDIQHRFGLVGKNEEAGKSNAYDDFYGFFAPSNMRLGFNYVPVERLQLGFGITKERLTWDFNVKYALLQQGRSGGSPVSVTYLGNMAVDTREKAYFLESSDRFSYFHQLMVARKITKSLSFQVSANLSHRNFPEFYVNKEQGITSRMDNDHISMSILGRYKITDALGFIINYDQPLSSHAVEEVEPEPNLSFGIEMTSSAHAFQIFAGNYQSIIPQLNNTKNKNKMGDGEFAIGFNITRLFNW